jgi:hypothetical protein
VGSRRASAAPRAPERDAGRLREGQVRA